MHRDLFKALGIAVVLIATTAQNARAQPDPVGMNYGTPRQLRTCPDRTQPSKGPISVPQAKALVACSYEDKPPYNATVRFVDIVDLQIAKNTRPVNMGDISRWPQIDQQKPVNVLRGSVVVHSCANLAGSQKAGSNCTRFETPNAIGTCWQDQFAAWFCFLGGPAVKETRQQPAPQP